MTHREKAEALFREGYNCSQSVLGAFSEEFGLEPKQAMMLSAGLGGGVGRMREVCGAVTGMALVLSAQCGYYEPKDSATKADLYAAIQGAAERFRRQNGSLVCRELLGTEKGSPVPEQRTEQYYHKRPCVEMVGSAAEILEEIFAQSAEK